MITSRGQTFTSISHNNQQTQYPCLMILQIPHEFMIGQLINLNLSVFAAESQLAIGEDLETEHWEGGTERRQFLRTDLRKRGTEKKRFMGDEGGKSEGDSGGQVSRLDGLLGFYMRVVQLLLYWRRSQLLSLNLLLFLNLIFIISKIYFYYIKYNIIIIF